MKWPESVTRIILDHTIVGQPEALTINKNREWAACRICGAIFQSVLNSTQVSDEEYWSSYEIRLAAQLETHEWRQKHNKTHSESEHAALAASGRTMTPEAALKLAPFGIVPVADAEDAEVAQAMREAPRAPVDDVESSLRGTVLIPKGVK